MLTVPAPSAVKALIAAHIAHQWKGATVCHVTGCPRATFDGSGYDVAWDFTVTWIDGDFATHQGTVRDNGSGPAVALYGGHYNFGLLASALEDHKKRQGHGVTL